MISEPSRNKIDAIYELREAVEVKVHAEHELAATGSDAARDALLDAQIAVEAKTQDAIDVCHACGQAHVGDEAHEPVVVADRCENVIEVDFRREAEGA